MTINHIIALIGMALSAFVALIVAYLHRKQIRQIELYKEDPSVGLVPPPGKLTAFIKGNWDNIFAYGGPIYIIASEILKDSPVTRLTVLLIAFNAALLMLNITLSLVYRIQGKLSEQIVKLADFDSRQISLIEELFKRTGRDDRSS